MKNKASKIILISITAIAVAVALTLVITVLYVTCSDDYVKLDKSKLNYLDNNLRVLDVYGDEINEPIYIEGYKQIELDTLPSYTPNAFVSIEDKRYYSHRGIDLRRMFGAALNNLKSHGFKEGASTISQQLIKNTHLDNQKTIKRKINEIILATQLERAYNKHEILEMYLNTIYFGKNAYGIESASNVYFGKSAKDLTLSESAVLAGLIKAPSTYAPTSNKEKCICRRNIVLKSMLENGFIEETEYNNAIAEEVSTIDEGVKPIEKGYMYGVLDEACKVMNVSRLQLLNSGFTISTYFDPKCQMCLERAVKNDSAISSQNSVNGVVAIALDAKSGTKGFFSRGINSPISTKRAIGSTIKPLAVYTPAFEERKITQASPVLDEFTDFGGYRPQNFGNKYYGWTTVKDAILKSLNVPSIKVLNSVGLETSEKYLNKLGFQSAQNTQNLSLALGNINGGANILELSQAYAALANQGNFNECSFISEIKKGTATLYKRKICDERVFSPQSAYLMTDILTEVSRKGTANKLNGIKFNVATKTGTVGNKSGNTDAIICGYTSDTVFTFWMQNDTMMPNTVTGGNIPTVLAKSFLTDYYRTQIPASFQMPDGVRRCCVDKALLSDKQIIALANSQIKHEEQEIFAFDKNNMPKQFSERNLEEKPMLSASLNGNTIEITVKNNKKEYLLYKSVDTETILVGKIKDSFTDSDVKAGATYRYYILSDNGKTSLTDTIISIPVDIDLTEIERGERRFFDLWYFPM
ncbi:MAG: transglycosylase domain-containing protein [Corallococcus sp.]|nr:transglycosylase domain-containing protein [Corallococcus sp.]